VSPSLGRSERLTGVLAEPVTVDRSEPAEILEAFAGGCSADRGVHFARVSQQFADLIERHATQPAGRWQAVYVDERTSDPSLRRRGDTAEIAHPDAGETFGSRKRLALLHDLAGGGVSRGLDRHSS